MKAPYHLGTDGKSIHAGPAPIYRKAGRLSLLRIGQGVLFVKGLDVKEQHPTCWCHRGLNSGDMAGVWRAADGSNARLSGIVTCGNVWACPVCAAKICEERRKELSVAMTAAVSMGKTAYLVTLTYPHEADMPLAESMGKFSKARQHFSNSKTYRRIMGDKDHPGGEIGRLGSVTSLEVTIGQANGWHPHVHVLVIADRLGFGEGAPINDQGDLASKAIADLQGQWVTSLQKASLCTAAQITDVFKHGLNVRGGERAAEYIAKFGRDERWGASSEVTKGHAKIGTVGEIAGDMHFTPFQLLDFIQAGNVWARHRFVEYVEAFKGKRMLSWTPGLRKALVLGDERTAEEIAADDTPPPEEVQVAMIDADALSLLTSRALLGDFHRHVAENCGNPDTAQGLVNDYIAWAASLPPAGRGLITVKGAFDGRRRAIQMREAA